MDADRSSGAARGGPARRARRRARRRSLLGVAQTAILAAGLLWLTLEGARGMGYNWQWYRVPRYLWRIYEGQIIWGPLMKGLAETCRIALTAFILTLAIGLAVALAQRAAGLLAPALARAYVELVRNTPLLVQLYLFYFVLAPILGIDRWWAGVLCLAVFEGAFAAEIVRAGIAAVPRGQWEAADALGLARPDVLRSVVLPQALRLMLAPLTNLAITLVKHSSIVSVIAVFELTTQARNVISDTFMSFEIWFTVAAMYLVVTLSLSLVATLLERRLEPAR
jgi:polar amino acid transport system permease protein